MFRALESIPTNVLDQYRDGNTDSEEPIYFWFDLFSNNQNGLHDPPPFEWWCETFMNAIETIHHVIMVICPWDNPIPLQRAWCLWEIYCALKTKSTFNLIMSPSESERFHAMILDEIDNFYMMLGNVDLRNSQAWNPADRSRIFEVVEKTVGFGRLNTLVIGAIRHWIISDFHSTFIKEIKVSLVDVEQQQSLIHSHMHAAIVYADLLTKAYHFEIALRVLQQLYQQLEQFPLQDSFLKVQCEIIMAEGISQGIVPEGLWRNHFYFRFCVITCMKKMLALSKSSSFQKYDLAGDSGFEYSLDVFHRSERYLQTRIESGRDGQSLLETSSPEMKRWIRWFLRIQLNKCRLLLKDLRSLVMTTTEETINTCLEHCQRYSGTESVLTAEAMSLLGDFHCRNNHPEAALPHYQQVLPMYQKLLSESHPKVIQTFGKLGEIYCLLDDYSQARQLLEQAYQKECEKFGHQESKSGIWEALIQCQLYQGQVWNLINTRYSIEMLIPKRMMFGYWRKYQQFTWKGKLFSFCCPLFLMILLYIVTSLLISLYSILPLAIEIPMVVCIRGLSICLPLRYRLPFKQFVRRLSTLITTGITIVFTILVFPCTFLSGIIYSCTEDHSTETLFV